MTFAEAADVTITGEIEDGSIQDYTIRALLEENRKHFNNASNESRRGDDRLAQFVTDKFGDDYNSPRKFRQALEFMSNDLKFKVTPYGMTPALMRGL